MSLLFNTLQSYAWILYHAEKLLASESSDKEVNRIEHQINTRIYNNAFCGLLRTGFPFELTDVNNVPFIRISTDGNVYQCPESSAKNILRAEYESLIKQKNENTVRIEDSNHVADLTEQAAEIQKNTSEISASPKPEETNRQEELPSSNTVIKKEDNSETVSQQHKSKSTFSHLPNLPSLDDFDFAPAKSKQTIEIDTQINETSSMEYPTPDSETSLPDTENAISHDKEQNPHRETIKNDKIDSGMDVDTERKDVISENTVVELDNHTPAPVPPFLNEELKQSLGEVNAENKISHSIPTPEPTKKTFQPKVGRTVPNHAAVSVTDDNHTSNTLEHNDKKESTKQKSGFLSTLLSRKKTDETVAIEEHAETEHVDSEDTKVENPKQETPVSETVEYQEPDSQTEKEAPIKNTIQYSHDGGQLFKHIHQINLKKKYGESSVGPYRFIFWPIRVVEKFAGKTWADFLVHVTDPNGNEQVLCTNKQYKELIIKMDGKEFNVFATWTNGIFDSHVTLLNKTESMYNIDEQVFKEEPKEIKDDFLDQFRYERKGQPKHFIVPFKNNNRGEANIPIVGYVEMGGKIYPLERRDGNTLRYRYSGNDKIIQGHWENERFTFTIEDANRLMWEEGVL